MLKLIRKIVKPFRLAYLRWAMRDAEYAVSHARGLREFSVLYERQQQSRQLALAEKHSKAEAW
jgi:hypothetical protein